jgi:ABC-type uncharacterized transport system fused permease/ATPase subunit
MNFLIFLVFSLHRRLFYSVFDHLSQCFLTCTIDIHSFSHQLISIVLPPVLLSSILLHLSLFHIQEATSALDLENEKAMYDALNLLSITYVSVGHRPSLLRYHSKKLVLLGPGLPPKVVDVTASESAIEMMDLVGTSL